MRLSFAKWMPIQHNFTQGGMSLVPRGLAVQVTDDVKGSLPTLGGVQARRSRAGFPLDVSPRSPGCPGPAVIAQRADIINLVETTGGVLDPGF